jgi:hypothetical protein
MPPARDPLRTALGGGLGQRRRGALDGGRTARRSALAWEAPEVASRSGEGWEGAWLDPATGLSLLVERGPMGLVARFGGKPEAVTVLSDTQARTASLRLSRDGAGMALARPIDNLRAALAPLPPPAGEAIPEGEFTEAETGSRMVIASFGGAPHAGFEGPLGRGAFEPMRPLGGDVWHLACRRSLDAPAPWDWTLRVERGPGGGRRRSRWDAGSRGGCASVARDGRRPEVTVRSVRVDRDGARVGAQAMRGQLGATAAGEHAMRIRSVVEPAVAPESRDRRLVRPHGGAHRRRRRGDCGVERTFGIGLTYAFGSRPIPSTPHRPGLGGSWAANLDRAAGAGGQSQPFHRK